MSVRMELWCTRDVDRHCINWEDERPTRWSDHPLLVNLQRDLESLEREVIQDGWKKINGKWVCCECLRVGE